MAISIVLLQFRCTLPISSSATRNSRVLRHDIILLSESTNFQVWGVSSMGNRTAIATRPMGTRLAAKFLTALILCSGLVGASLAVFAQPASAAPGPFVCQPGFYQVVSGQFQILNPVTGADISIGAANPSYNSLGYDPVDNYIYGLSSVGGNTSHLLRVANDGSVTDLGLPTGLPVSNYFVGAFNDSQDLIVYGPAGWYSIDVTTNIATVLPLSATILGSDVVIVGGVAYLVIDQTLNRVDMTNFTVTSDTISGLPSGANSYGSAWTDGSANLYFRNNATGGVYKISDYSTSSPSSTLLITGAPTGQNDGTSCPTAPDPYIAPTATNDAYTTPYQTPLSVATRGIMINDTGTSLTVTSNTNPSHGTVTVNADGSFLYTPNAGFSGTDSYTYTVTDFFGRTASATVTITISPPGSTTTTTTTTTPVVPLEVAANTDSGDPVAGALPMTGSHSGLLGEAGLMFILMGLGLSLISRKFLVSRPLPLHSPRRNH